jgi:hypothetical protein
MVTISLDISLRSTAMVIYNSEYNSYKYFSYIIANEKNKWVTQLSNIVNFRFYMSNISRDYTENEIMKLMLYNKIATDLVSDIINENNNCKKNVILEGYSYLSVGPLIDLVTIGSIIRSRVIQLADIVEFMIVAPKTLKTKTCRLVYGYEEIIVGKRKKKLVERDNSNHQGIIGNNFKKEHMVQALIDSKYDDIFSMWVKDNINSISMKNIPKPIDDIVDAMFLNKIYNG